MSEVAPALGFKRRLWIAAILVTAAACSSSSSSPPPSSTTNPRAVSKVVGASGGEVATEDRAAAVEIPAGALSQDVQVTITPLDTPPPVSERVLGGPAVELGPEGTTFSAPVRVVLAFDPAMRPANLSEDVLPSIHSAPRGAAASAFLALPTERVDATHVAAFTTHFSWWVTAWPAGADAGADTAPPCVPRTCQQVGANCGPLDDGCGGIVQCGTCPLPDSGTILTCGGGGTPNVCGNACVPRTCPAKGCGPMPDGCGATVDCKGCTSPETCGGGGTPSVCGTGPCIPKTCKSAGAQCGLLADGCGSIVQCGACPGTQKCGEVTPNVCSGS